MKKDCRQKKRITTTPLWQRAHTGFTLKGYSLLTMTGTNINLEMDGNWIRDDGSHGFIISAASGYEIEDVKIDGVSFGAISRHTVPDRYNHNVEATLKKVEVIYPDDTDSSEPESESKPDKASTINSSDTNPAVSAMPFTDVAEGQWYYESVLAAYTNGLFSGTSTTTFEPDSLMSRSMMVQMLHNLSAAPASTTSGFTDVSDDALKLA